MGNGNQSDFKYVLEKLSNFENVPDVGSLLRNLLKIIGLIEDYIEKSGGNKLGDNEIKLMANVDDVIGEAEDDFIKEHQDAENTGTELDTAKLDQLLALQKRIKKIGGGILEFSRTSFLLNELSKLETDIPKIDALKAVAKWNECHLLLKNMIDSPLSFQWLKNKTPLWYYILLEAAQSNDLFGLTDEDSPLFGPIGSMIVVEVFLGLLSQDPNAYWNIYPTWTPDKEEVLKIPTIGDRFELRDIVKFAGMPINQWTWTKVAPTKTS